MTKKKTKELSPAFEAVKELLRIAILASAAVLVDGLQKGHVDWKLVGVSALIAVIKAIDKYFHKSGVEKGIFRF